MSGHREFKDALYAQFARIGHALASPKRIELLAVLPGPIDTDMVKALPMPKASPADTAHGVLAGIARGEEEIFPDPMARQMGAPWNRSHKELERAFASF